MALPKLGALYVHYGNGSNTGYFAVPAWATNTVKAVGALVRPTAPSLGNERVRVCIVAGTTHATTEPTWTTTRGAKNTDNTVTWQECTGQPALNGDLTNTLTWTDSKAQASTPSLGVIIKDASNNLFICTTSGAVGGSEPTWDTTKGNTTADSSAVWTCISNGAFGAWAAPFPRLSSACASTWGAAGDTFYVASDSAEVRNNSGSSITAPGTADLPSRILSVSAAGSLPPVAADLTAGASIACTGTGQLALAGVGYFWGLTFKSQKTTGAITVGESVFSYLVLDTCALVIDTNTASDYISMNQSSTSRTVWRNTTVTFGDASQFINLAGFFDWGNTSGTVLGTVPSILIKRVGLYSARLHGLDLSALGSGAVADVSATGCSELFLEDCRLHASTTISSGSVAAQAGQTVQATACDSTAACNRYYLQNYMGVITQETTIVRSGGASDGTTPFSRKLVSTANSQLYLPLVGDPIVVWNETLATTTLSIPVVTDGVTLTTADCWLEVEYLGNASYPLASLATGRVATVLTTGSSWATDTASNWTTTGLSSPVKQTLSVSFTPALVGPYLVRVCLARASTTVYVDPKVQTA